METTLHVEVVQTLQLVTTITAEIDDGSCSRMICVECVEEMILHAVDV